jgi:hypothetical protein
MTRHPLCDQGDVLANAAAALDHDLADRIAALFATLAPIEAFANERAGDAWEAEVSRIAAIAGGAVVPLRLRENPQG